MRLSRALAPRYRASRWSANLDELYITNGDKGFKAQTKMEGIVSWRSRIKPGAARCSRSDGGPGTVERRRPATALRRTVDIGELTVSRLREAVAGCGSLERPEKTSADEAIQPHFEIGVS